jgi:hypothetical protein
MRCTTQRLTHITVIPLSIPASTSISTLTSLLALRTNLPPTDLRLVFAGKHLGPSNSTLETHHILRESTLHLALPLRGGMAGKKPTCEFKKGDGKTAGDKCTQQIQRIVGECGFCGGKFCSKHRLLESHACPNLEDCKKESYEQNASKLIAERTVAIRGV